VAKLPLHDFNCGYKAYRCEAVQSLQLYGEMHRYVPCSWPGRASRSGARRTPHPRRFGRSKYGVERFVRLLRPAHVVSTALSRAPLHLFGVVGLLLSAVGGAALLTSRSLALNMDDRQPAVVALRVLCVLAGLQLSAPVCSASSRP